VAFADLGVNREGLNNGAETLPWHEVSKIKIDDEIILALPFLTAKPWQFGVFEALSFFYTGGRDCPPGETADTGNSLLARDGHGQRYH
jgi:hypothetical protein